MKKSSAKTGESIHDSALRCRLNPASKRFISTPRTRGTCFRPGVGLSRSGTGPRMLSTFSNIIVEVTKRKRVPVHMTYYRSATMACEKVVRHRQKTAQDIRVWCSSATPWMNSLPICLNILHEKKKKALYLLCRRDCPPARQPVARREWATRWGRVLRDNMPALRHWAQARFDDHMMGKQSWLMEGWHGLVLNSCRTVLVCLLFGMYMYVYFISCVQDATQSSARQEPVLWVVWISEAILHTLFEDPCHRHVHAVGGCATGGKQTNRDCRRNIVITSDVVNSAGNYSSPVVPAQATPCQCLPCILRPDKGFGW